MRKASENGAKGGRPPKDNNGLAKPIGLSPDNQDEKLSLTTTTNTNSVSSDDETAAPDPIKALFDRGVSILTNAGAKDAAARSLIGKWRKEFGVAAVLEAISVAENELPSEPIGFLTQCLARTRKTRWQDTGVPPMQY